VTGSALRKYWAGCLFIPHHSGSSIIRRDKTDAEFKNRLLSNQSRLLSNQSRKTKRFKFSRRLVFRSGLQGRDFVWSGRQVETVRRKVFTLKMEKADPHVVSCLPNHTASVLKFDDLTVHTF
jgi:hypothetical protein